jgi:hypothetical protein
LAGDRVRSGVESAGVAGRARVCVAALRAAEDCAGRTSPALSGREDSPGVVRGAESLLSVLPGPGGRIAFGGCWWPRARSGWVGSGGWPGAARLRPAPVQRGLRLELPWPLGPIGPGWITGGSIISIEEEAGAAAELWKLRHHQESGRSCRRPVATGKPVSTVFLQCRSTGVQEYRYAGVQECRSAGIPLCGNAGVRESCNAGVQVLRNADFPVYRTEAFGGSRSPACSGGWR